MEEFFESFLFYVRDIFTEDLLTPVAQEVSDEVFVPLHLLALFRSHAGDGIDQSEVSIDTISQSEASIEYYLGMAVLAQLLASPMLMKASELQIVEII